MSRGTTPDGATPAWAAPDTVCGDSSLRPRHRTSNWTLATLRPARLHGARRAGARQRTPTEWEIPLMPKTDKLIVTNVAALRGKYGAAGVRAIRRAVTRLIQSDSRRGLVTRLLDVGSGPAMEAIGAPEVTNALNVHQNKSAIDGAYRHFVP